MLLWCVAAIDQRLQSASIGPRNLDDDTVAHAADSHTHAPLGIPIGIQMSDFIH
jgi:hypothetical protein